MKVGRKGASRKVRGGRSVGRKTMRGGRKVSRRRRGGQGPWGYGGGGNDADPYGYGGTNIGLNNSK